MRRRLALAAISLLLSLVPAGCKRTKKKVGVGRWRFGDTQVRDATGRCSDTTLPDGRLGTWCFGQPTLTLENQLADVDLYFSGRTPDAPLIEIFMRVRACDEGATMSWLRAEFGAPDESIAERLIWQTRGMRIVASVPSQAGRCTIRFFPLTELAEFERVRDGRPRPNEATP